MRHFLFFTFLSMSVVSCREFYDEEFLEGGNESTVQDDVAYSATLQSSDPNLSQVSGDAKVDVTNGEVKTDIAVNNLPRNIIQVHYAYSASDCSAFNNASIPVEVGDTRNVTLSESFTTEALTFDVRSSSAGDINLENKSILIKGFSNLVEGNTAPAFIIACGTLAIDNTVDDGTSTTTDDTTTVDGTTTTTGEMTTTF